MKPSAFEYHDPSSSTEVLALLSRYGSDAKILAGGQSLVPLMNFRLARPEHLVDINNVTELEGWRHDGATLRLGALTRHVELERSAGLREVCPLLGQAAAMIGHPQIRSRGTLGGSLAHGDGAAELPGAMLALDATMVAVSSKGERRIPAKDFFTFHLTTDLQPDELLSHVEVPCDSVWDGSAYLEVAAREGDFAKAGSAVVLKVADSAVKDVRVVCIAVGPTPVRVEAVEDLVRGSGLGKEVLDQVPSLVAQSVEPGDEVKVSAAYRRRVAGALTRRALEQAWDSAVSKERHG